MATNQQQQRLEALYENLHRCKTYREFLQAYLEGRDLSLSDIARAAGFGRGFPGDVISGKRRLTAKSYYPFEKALKLPLAGKKYFRCLVAIEEPDIFPEFSSSDAQEMIVSLRKKPWVSSRRQAHETESPGFEQLLSEEHVIGVYAAAGKPEKGATREQIAQRMQIPSLELEKSLQKLEAIGLLEQREETYYPKDLHLFLKTSDHSQVLTTLFQKAVDKARRRVSNAVSSESEFFFTSQFCIRENAMPALKKALRETILKFVDEAIEPEGDRVVQLLTTLHL